MSANPYPSTRHLRHDPKLRLDARIANQEELLAGCRRAYGWNHEETVKAEDYLHQLVRQRADMDQLSLFECAPAGGAR